MYMNCSAMYNATRKCIVCHKEVYSSPSLSGHSQQKPPSLMWPKMFVTDTINAFTSPSRQRPPL